MREAWTIKAGLLLAVLTAATPARAQESAYSLQDLFSGFYDSGLPEPAPLATPPIAPTPSAATDDSAMATGWEATIAPEPKAASRPPKLTAAPREVRVPKPRVAARSDFWPAETLRPAARNHALTGIASYYWQGQMTASGEPYNKSDMTAAHRSLPFGTRVRVSCDQTGREVVVRINDRGPFKPGRVIDLSEAAAEAIGMRGRGLTPVRLEVLKN